MVRRVTNQSITFHFPFILNKLKKEFRAGTYTIETEEASIFGSSFLPFRHVGTTLFERPPDGQLGNTRYWPTSPKSLIKAIAIDAEKHLRAQQLKREDMTSEKLEHLYGAVLNEPIPPRLGNLIKQLKEADDK